MRCPLKEKPMRKMILLALVLFPGFCFADNVDVFLFNYDINKKKGDTGIVVSGDTVTLTGVRFDIYTGVKSLDKIVAVKISDIKTRRAGLQAQIDKLDAVVADIANKTPPPE